jgi:tetratricopeptide (TPR) repeat protein
MRFLIPLFFVFCFSFNSLGQGGGLDEEIGFQYVKAEYLFETGRFEDCINEFNQVIAKNPAFKEALIKRATAKYNLGAYKGAKMDALLSIELKGITADGAFILGKSENAMGNDEAAINSLSASISLKPELEALEIRALLYEKNEQLLKACADYNEAARMGSSKGEQKSRSLCGGYKSKINPPVLKPKPQDENTNPPVDTNEEKGQDTSSDEQSENDNTTDEETSPSTEPMEDPTIPKEDDFAQNIVIDDDLSISIYGQGLGRRKISDTPSILIIADETGNVTLDICVNNNGEVTKAEFNGTMSTIAKKSMVNLALRKAKEFVFEKSSYTTQCGYLIFKLKAE